MSKAKQVKLTIKNDGLAPVAYYSTLISVRLFRGKTATEALVNAADADLVAKDIRSRNPALKVTIEGEGDEPKPDEKEPGKETAAEVEQAVDKAVDEKTAPDVQDDGDDTDKKSKSKTTSKRSKATK